MSAPLHNEPDSLSVTTYNQYPNDRPLANPTHRTMSADSLPETNRQAVMSAMKKLQEKINKLDIERTTAQATLVSQAETSSRYRAGVRAEMANKEAHINVLERHTHQLESQLSDAGTRCNQLEQRLDDMRRLVRQTEEKLQSRPPNIPLPQQNDSETHLKRISDLELDRQNLSRTQTVAQDKVKELEAKLNLERARRAMLEEENVRDANENPKLVDFDFANLKPSRKRKGTKKKRPNYMRPKSTPGRHYRVKFSDIPFVAGKATTDSHAVGANVQKVLAMMKAHNRVLCKPSATSSTPSRMEIIDVLKQLEREFNHLTREHDSLLCQINVTDEGGHNTVLQSKLEDVITRMEEKSDQITKLKKYLNMKKVMKPIPRQYPLSAPPTPTGRTTVMTTTTKKPSEVKVTTTIRSKSQSGINVLPGNKAGASLNTLKCLKKLQTTLRPYDLAWE